MTKNPAGGVYRDGDGALADGRDRRRVGAHAVAREAAGGVGRAAEGGQLRRMNGSDHQRPRI
jgi:hypothetical protein